MPKNKSAKGARPAKNYDPRYGERKTAGAGSAGGPKTGSRSPKHRGYRPEEAQDSPRKQRWSAQEKAGRDESRGIRQRADGGRVQSPHHRGESSDRGAYGARPARYAQGQGYRSDRTFGDDRGGRYQDRPYRSDRGDSANSGEREGRGRYQQDRPYRENRFAQGADRGGYGAGSGRSDRYENRDSRENRNDRPYRQDRPQRDGQPSFGDDRSRSVGRTTRPYERNDRPDRGQERFGQQNRYSDCPRREEGYRSDRPERSERPSYSGGGNPREGRPAYGQGRPDYSSRDSQGDRGNRYGRNERSDRGTGRPDFATDRRREAARSSFRDDRSNRTETTHIAQQEDVVHERLEALTVAASEIEGTGFADLGLGNNIVEALAKLGAATPFPIQVASIPAIIEGRDVLGRGRTGSGKTIAFGAPLVERILSGQAGKRRAFGRKPQALVLAPTRELALQIDRTIQPIARSVGLFTTQIYGGVPQGRQVGALRKGVDIIIGTPGRIEDLIEQGVLDLSDVQVTVLDEADHMCELGFVEPVKRILGHIAPSTGDASGSQKLMFSATLDREVASLVEEFLVNPAVYEVSGETQDTGTIDHRVLVVDRRDKAELLEELVDREGKTLVFTRTRAYADMLAEQFADAGIPAVALHGDLNQAKRTRNLQRMSEGRVRVLVATDVAARGIHVDDIDLVVQADAPDEYKTYLHRSGRTGRAGRTGRVVTLIAKQRQRRMSELLDRAEIQAPFAPARPGDDVVDEITGRLTLAEVTA